MKIRSLLFNPIFIRISAAVISLVGILLLTLGLQKDIMLIVNGEPKQISSSALTVRGVLRSQDYKLTEWDHLYPAPGTLLWGEETIYYRLSSTIEIQADGTVISLQTAESRPENVLLEAGINVFPKDRILVDGQQTSSDALLKAGKEHNIEVLRGTPITVITESGAFHFVSDADSLTEAFEKKAYKVLDADQFSEPLDTPLDGSPITVEWIQAEPIQVVVADQSFTIYTTAKRIGTALAGAGFALQGRDYSIPAEDELIPENRRIQLIRVREQVLLDQENIQFDTSFQPDINTELDQVSVMSGGEFGISTKQFRITYENGQEISRVLEKEWILREPDPRIIGYGTQVNLHTENTPDGEITYWRKITAYATSYNENCAGCNDWTYSGAYLQKGVIAVTRDWYRYMAGLRVYIPGYGFATIEDIGAGVSWSTNWVDLGYRSEDYVSWHHYVDVYFLAPIPPLEDIMYVLY